MNKTENIISSGCSWVWGPYDWDKTWMENRDNDQFHIPRKDKINFNIKEKEASLYSFSQQLAKKLNILCYNVASPGYSVEDVFNKLFQVIEENKLENSFVVVGLTEPTRFKIGTQKFKFVDNDDGFWEWKKIFFKRYYNEHYRIKYIMMMLDLFYEYLKNRNSKLVVFNSFCEEINYPNRDYFFKKFKTWEGYIKSYDKQFLIGTHPIEYDHKILCNLLYEEYFYEKI